MILNGWQRLGVIFSALWLVAVLVFAAVEYKTADKYRFLSTGKSQNFVYWASSEFIDPFKLQVGENFDSLSKVEQLSVVQERERISKGLSIKILVGNLIFWIFVPILASWLLAYATLLSIRWVHKGF